MEWKTIDSAPKDGTRILVSALLSTDNHFIDLVAWGQGVRRANWRRGFEHGPALYLSPTHWMPLPDPPSPR